MIRTYRTYSILLCLAIFVASLGCEKGEEGKTSAEKSVEYAQYGLLEESVAEFETAIEQNPEDVSVRYNYGVALLSLKRFKEAEEVFRKVLLMKPEHALALNNLGVIHQERKEYDSAVETFKKVISLNSKLPYAQQNLAMVYKSLGKVAEAREAYQAALALEPNNENIKEAIRRLEPG